MRRITVTTLAATSGSRDAAIVRSWSPLLLVLVAGCDLVLGLREPPVEEPPVDARTDDAPPGLVTSCAVPILTDPFDGGDPCAPWGSTGEPTATITSGSGELVISNISTAGSGAACTADPPPGNTRAVGLEVTHGIVAPGAYVLLEAYGPDEVQMTAKIVQQDVKLTLYDYGGVPINSVDYDPSGMRWWRIRPDPRRTGMIGEYSADAREWRELGVVPGVVPGAIAKVVIGAGTNLQPSNALEARFGQIDFCADAASI